MPPSMIEIYPRKMPNTHYNIAKSAVELFNNFKEEFGELRSYISEIRKIVDRDYGF